jgi:A/G-specific adenine glycosylase
MNLVSFKNTVWKFYKAEGRGHLPWRKTTDPYKILVSEVMLQQTQVDRVIPKYKSFLKKFPSVKALANAKTKDVLLEWQGLGYNRRAFNLQRAAAKIVSDFGNKFPQTLEELLTLPGVGRATSGDLLAFAYNKPAVVIETNIRTVFIHHFFPTSPKLRGASAEVSDKQILELIEKTLDKKNPREWYYALMDYGTHLKKTLGNNAVRSKHYKKQSRFEGSNRQLRSHILKLVLAKPRTEAEIIKLMKQPVEAINKNLLALSKEGLIQMKNGRISA